MEAAPRRLQSYPVHLGLGGRVEGLAEFTGSGEWYQAYEQSTAADGADGRLVSWHTFDESWTSWEMHPAGAELVLCVEGDVTLVQEIDGREVPTRLRAGEWATNEAGVWHSADVADGIVAPCVFITAGLGTQGRSR
jgi:hypothetical protein